MNILLLNLTRFGDLLQSQAAITDLVGQGHAVAILCLENFTEAAHLLSGLSKVFSLPGAALLAALQEPSGQPEQGWHKAFAELALLREQVQTDFAPDLVCNMAPSLAARMLARFVAGDGACGGFFVDAHGFGVNSNAWAAFLQGASVTRGVSPFNIVDIFRRMVEGDLSAAEQGGKAASAPLCLPGDASLRLPEAAVLQAARERLAGLAPAGCKGYIALQLGASEERRRWPGAFFASLGDRLWREEGLCPVLLGSKAEQELARRYALAATGPFIDMCGATGLNDLAAVLRACRLLVSNDTGTMHYAAGLGLPVLAIFLATAQAVDTGPYREGCCSVEPSLPCHPCSFDRPCPHCPSPQAMLPDEEREPCRRAISPELLAHLALSRLRHGVWNMPDNTIGARVWESSYDAEGFMSLRSLSGHEGETRSLWFVVQQHYLRQFLNRDRASAFLPRALPEPVLLNREDGEALLRDIREAAALAELLAQQGKLLAIRPAAMRDRFLATWQKTHSMFKRSPYLGALSLLWLQETQAEGQELSVVVAVVEHFQQLLVALLDIVALRDD